MRHEQTALRSDSRHVLSSDRNRYVVIARIESVPTLRFDWELYRISGGF